MDKTALGLRALHFEDVWAGNWQTHRAERAANSPEASKGGCSPAVVLTFTYSLYKYLCNTCYLPGWEYSREQDKVDQVEGLPLRSLSSGQDTKITADGDCSHEIKRGLLLGRKAMTSLSSVQLLSCLTLCDPMNRSTPGFPVHHLDSILKSRDITLPAKVCLVKNMVFPVVMYGCETWTIKKAECHHNWCFWTMVLEKTVESLGLQGDPTSQS